MFSTINYTIKTERVWTSNYQECKITNDHNEWPDNNDNRLPTPYVSFKAAILSIIWVHMSSSNHNWWHLKWIQRDNEFSFLITYDAIVLFIQGQGYGET